MQVYTEGAAKIKQGKGIFLNPKMSKLRDISVLFLKALGGEKDLLLDSTAATGIRGIRYKKEAGIKKVTFLDINKDALKCIKANLKANKVKAETVGQGIQEYANANNPPFGIIDLDPFGSPAPYIYDIMKMCKGETTLMVTATDTAVLCGAHAAACLKQYNAKPMHNELCKEAGVRILIGFIAKIAAQFNFGLRVRLSISDMHYIRVFATLERGAIAAVESVKQLGYLSSCRKCKWFKLSKGIVPVLPSRCESCNGETEKAGPMWSGNLCDKTLLSKMLSIKGETYKDAIEQMRVIYNELDQPFFYSIPSMTQAIKIGSVSPRAVIERLKKKGYLATQTQFDPESIKTSADSKEVMKTIASIKSA